MRLHAYMCDRLCECIHACVEDTTCVAAYATASILVWQIMHMYSCRCGKYNVCSKICDDMLGRLCNRMCGRLCSCMPACVADSAVHACLCGGLCNCMHACVALTTRKAECGRLCNRITPYIVVVHRSLPTTSCHLHCDNELHFNRPLSVQCGSML